MTKRAERARQRQAYGAQSAGDKYPYNENPFFWCFNDSGP
jgi:hypothetical protein